MSGYVQDTSSKASSSQACGRVGQVGRQRSPILTAAQCSQWDTFDYNFSDGASDKRGSVE
jgi:hypothetical protein